MKFHDMATRVARAALSIEEPPRHADELAENLLSCHRDGDLVARMRFMQLLAETIFPEPGAAEEFGRAVQTQVAGSRRYYVGPGDLWSGTPAGSC